ncbi:hypothetical protein B7P43_G09014 [Cryptotermes secundus]|uniref:Uncharacterized protein n=4 Tax=Cryptotermes secundus TaxID=105785 RepID=A0A2J7PQ20_9NEOP|nr:hypothetical protein B7P43_G09014 [Cryptotermes secundus]
MHQRVPTSSSTVSAPNPIVSHTGRSEFKHHLTYMPEKISPSSISSTMKPRPPSLFLPTVRKSTDSLVTTSNTGIGGNTRKRPAPRSTSSFRRSVEHAMGDNWIAPTTNSVSVVTSQSSLASIPRFSSRYRSELLRATGHGLRGTTAPVYVPTVPTVSTTSTTVQSMFSDTPPDALNLLDVTESRTPSSWKHTITSQSISHTLSPNKASTHTSNSHNAKQALESKTSVSSHKSSVLSVSVQQSITGGATVKHSDSRRKSTTQESNPLANSSPSLDRWNLQTNLKNSEMNSAQSTRDFPNTDIPTAKDIIKNTETMDFNGVPNKLKATTRSRQNLLTNSSKITLKETQNIQRESFPVTIPSNLKTNITTIINKSAATEFNLKPDKIITSSAAVTSVLTKENPSDTQKYSDFTTEVALIVDQKSKNTIQSQKKSLGNNFLLQNFHDIIIPSTTKSPPMKTIKTVFSDPAVTENMPVQFAVKSTPPPKGRVGSTTSRVVRVRDVKSSLQPAATTVSTISDRTISQSRVQARAATEVPISFTTTDLPITTTDLIVNDIFTSDLPTTIFETLNLQTTTLSTTDALSMTEPSFDLSATTELPTIAPRTTISKTTNIPEISPIPTTTLPVTTTSETVSTIPTTDTPATTTIPTTTIFPVTQTMPIPTTTPTTTASPSTPHPQVTTISIITLQDADSNVRPLSVTQTTPTAVPRVFTTTLRTPAPYVIFGIYPNGTVFRKLPNSDFKEQVHENEIARRNPFYPDQRYFSTTPSAPAQSVDSNEITLQAPSFDDGFNAVRNQIQDEDAQVPQLPTAVTTRPQLPPAPTEAPSQTSGFALGKLISNALDIDPQKGSLPSTRAKFLAEIVRNSNIITARTTTTMTTTATTTTTTAKTTTTPAPMPALPTSTVATPKATANPAAGVLDDFSFLNVLLLGRPPDDTTKPGRNQGSSIANRIIQVALERGNSSRKKPSATTPRVTTPKMTTPNTATQTPTTPKATTTKASTSASQQPSMEQNQEDLAALLKLIGNMESTTPGNLTPSQQLLADFLIKQATSQPSERNLNNQISIQDVLNPPATPKTSKKLKSSPTTEAAPGQLLGELFGPLIGGNQGDTKIRDPRAGQGLVEAAIKATKTVSQLMGSVIQGATKSLQSFMKSLAWGSGAGSG